MIERSGVCFSPLSRWFAAFLPTPRSFMAQILNFAFSNQCYKKYITYTSLYINKYIYIICWWNLVDCCWFLESACCWTTRWWGNAHLATAASCRPPGPRWPAPAVPTTRLRMPWAWWRPRRKRWAGLGDGRFRPLFSEVSTGKWGFHRKIG